MTYTRSGLVLEDIAQGFGTVNTENAITGALEAKTKVGLHSWKPRIYNVEDFGATGVNVAATPTVNVATAFASAITQCKTDRAFLYVPRRAYLVQSTLLAGGTTEGQSLPGIVSDGGEIVFSTSGTPGIDWTGGQGPNRVLQNIVLKGSSTNPPNVTLLLGRPNSGASAGVLYGEHVIFSGQASVALMYNHCSEENLWVGSDFRNDNGECCVILSRQNARGITSTLSSLPVSSAIHMRFLGCTFNNKSTGAGVTPTAALELATVRDVTLYSCQFDSPNVTNFPLVRVKQESGGVNLENIRVRDCLFHATYDVGVQVDANTTVRYLILRGNKWQGTPLTAAVRLTGPACNIQQADIEAPSIDASSTGVNFTNNSRIFISTLAGTGGVGNFTGGTFNGQVWGGSGQTITFNSTGSAVRGRRFLPDLGAMQNIGVSSANFSNGDTTPSVGSGHEQYVFVNSSPTTVTNFDDANDGREFWARFTTANTTISFTGANIKGNAGVDFTAKADDSIHARRMNGVWHVMVSVS